MKSESGFERRGRSTVGTVFVFVAALVACDKSGSSTAVAAPQATEDEVVYMSTEPKAQEAKVDVLDTPGPYFVLNGQPFCFQGTNNYYLIYKSPRMVTDVLRSEERRVGKECRPLLSPELSSRQFQVARLGQICSLWPSSN